jgi:SWI/SNF-related matrix-associated actin-dependent regulator 1 of chromatin subfamily A
MTYAQQKLPEPTLSAPEGTAIRVRLAPDGERFAVRLTQPASARLAFKHVCHAHGGEYSRGAYSFDYMDFVPLIDHLSSFGVKIQPAPELRPRLVDLADMLEGQLDELDTHIAEFPHALYPYQREGAEYLATHARAALFDEMGLGKTIQVLAALPPMAAVLVVCPASMRLTWAKEGEKWRPDIAWTVAQTTAEITNPKPGQAIVCGPEGLIRATAKLGGDAVTLVCDEAHYYKNEKAKRTKSVAAIAARCGRAWIATGTPMTNRPPDLRGVLQTFGLFKRAWPTVRYFDIAFGVKFDHASGSIDWPAEPPHPDAIVTALSRVSIRRSRAEVLPELPDKTYGDVHVDLRGSKVKVPEATRGQQELFKAVDHKGLEVISFDDFSGLGDMRAALASSKIPQMLDVIDRFLEQDVPLVVCSVNVAPLEALQARGFPVVMGSVATKKRHANVEDFQAGRENIIGIQTVAGGTGLTLTRACHMLMVQRDWIPANNVQAEDRVARIGQKAQAVTILDMLANHPLDEIISRNLRAKQTRIDQTVNRVKHDVTSGRELVERLRTLADYITQATES